MFRVACPSPTSTLFDINGARNGIARTRIHAFFTTHNSSPPVGGDTAVRGAQRLPAIIPKFPKRIILLRHGESLGNVDESLYAEIPDWKIPLTRRGEKQSLKAAKDLHALTKNESLFCYCSPYTRTKESWDIIKEHLEAQGDVEVIGTREEPRIAEQQFGNFQSKSTCNAHLRALCIVILAKQLYLH